MQMKSKVTGAIAVAAAAMVVLGGCSSSNTASYQQHVRCCCFGVGFGSAADNAGKRACVMLPDADSSSRWENGDRPALKKGFEDAGFEVDIQNALNDTGKYATLADQQLTQGCSVMLLVDLKGAGVQVATKAKAQGIPVIAYDRPIKGADLYISFDNFHVGELQGQMIVDAMKAKRHRHRHRKHRLRRRRSGGRQRQAVPRWRRQRPEGRRPAQAGVRDAGCVGRHQVRGGLRAGVHRAGGQG